MADFLQSNPLVILAILIGNSLLIAFLCYCGLRHWIGKRFYSNGNNVIAIPTTQCIIETPSEIEAEPSTGRHHAVLIVGSGYIPNNDARPRSSSLIEKGNEHERNSCLRRASQKDEPPPPNYFDIFPEQKRKRNP